MKKLQLQFEKMNKSAYLTLKLCLTLILFATCVLYIYIDSSDSDVIRELSYIQKHLFDSVAYSVVLALGGAFLLDYVHKRK